jgi:hypothetical protein
MGYIYIINSNGQLVYLFKYPSTPSTDFNGWNISLDINNDLFFINGQLPSDNFLLIGNYKTYTTKPAISLGGSSIALYSTPIKINNYLYQGTNSGLYKIDIVNSTIIKKSPNIYSTMNDNSPIVDNQGYIYIGANDRFVKFDQNLNPIWEYTNIPSANYNAASAIISMDKYIYLVDSANYNLICIDKNGNEVWTKNIPTTDTIYSTPCIGKNGYIYVCNGNSVVAFY